MKIGLDLSSGSEAPHAALAERHGLFGVMVGGESPGTEMIAAGETVAWTDMVRVIVRVPLGDEHPVTLAEDLAVLDNASGGRIVALVDSAELDASEASEDVELLRRSWSCRPVRHDGPRWRVPAGIEGHAAPDSVEVTPKPAQVELPVWLCGEAAAEVARTARLPVLADDMAACSATAFVQPAVASLTGELEPDRELVTAWASAGATHLLVRLPEGGDQADHLALVSRFLAPEVAMPEFPRIIAESKLPAVWEVPR